MRQILLILTLTALMAAFLAFGSSGVAFAQDEPAVLANDVTEDEKCADLEAKYEDNAEKTAEVAEEIEYCLTQVVEGQE